MHTRCFGFTEARHCYFSVHQIVCHEMFPFQNLKEKAKFISECILVRKLPQRPFFSPAVQSIYTWSLLQRRSFSIRAQV